MEPKNNPKTEQNRQKPEQTQKTPQKAQKSPKNEKTLKKTTQKSAFSIKSALKILALPLWVGIVLVAVQYIVVYALYFLLGREKLVTPVWTTVANAFIYTLALLAIIFLPEKIQNLYKNFKKKKENPSSKDIPKSSSLKTSREELGLKNLPTWSDILLAPAGFVVYFILATILVAIFSGFSFFDATEAQDVGYNFLSNGFDRVVAFIALCVVAPIAEETIFRGWLYGKLRAKIPGEKTSLILSILITSVLFATMHGQWNVGVNVFAMSVIVCLMREITGTIYSGILLHIIKNTIAFVLLYILGFGI
ncbi:CPBP family intramembrane metalloprotease [Candidatus Saccharibacteria bacterium]|nr:CPBP family intramembrane metalloprotease [Candidatus Saccharibacteria bacterium]